MLTGGGPVLYGIFANDGGIRCEISLLPMMAVTLTIVNLHSGLSTECGEFVKNQIYDLDVIVNFLTYLWATVGAGQLRAIR